MNLNISKSSVFNWLIWDNKDFIIPFAVIISVSLFLLGNIGNDSLFLYVNGHYSGFADFLFLTITLLGDGIIAVFLVIILLWVSYREALIFLLITLVLLIVVTVLKNYTFREMDRPLEYFGSKVVLRLVNGYDPPKLCTFPSGHSATAFSVFLYLSFLTKKRIVKFSMFLIACSVGYSRIYLSAHFPRDVVAGAILGVSITLICYYLGSRLQNSWIDKKIEFRPKILARERTI
jgi:membrane-associated phospholipid phosphatase